MKLLDSLILYCQNEMPGFAMFFFQFSAIS